MGELTAEAFADWLPPSDVVNWYYQQGLGDDEAEARVAAMLRDGLLRAAATQLVVDGRDLGLTLLERGLWERAIHARFWSTGRFRLRQGNQVISAYDVRIDRDVQTLPPVQSDAPAETVLSGAKQPLSEARLRAWAELFNAAQPVGTEATARASLGKLFPDSSVSRERLRGVLPDRRRGRPYRSQGPV